MSKRLQYAHGLVMDSREDRSQDRLLREAMTYHQAGQATQAAQAYQTILTENPKHPIALHLLGLLASQLGDSAKAVILLRQAVAVDPDNSEVWSNLGTALLNVGDLSGSAVAYGHSIETGPGLPGPYYNLGNVRYLEGNYAAAISCFQTAIDLKPDFVAAHFNLANTHLQLENLHEAIAGYRRVEALDHAYPSLQNNLGNALHQADDTDSAIKAWQLAALQEPSNPHAHNNLGCVLSKLGRHEEALPHLIEACRLNPNSADTWANRARTECELELYSEVLVSGGCALTFDPTNFSALCTIGLAYSHRGEADIAIEYYKQAFIGHEDDVDLIKNLGVEYVRSNHTTLGIKFFEELIAKHGEKADWLASLGFAYKDLGELETALLKTKRALTLDPSHEDAGSNYLLIQTYSPQVSNEEMLATAVDWSTRRYGGLSEFNILPRPTKRLKIGYVSADFHAHPAGHLYEALFPHHDRDRFEISVFAEMKVADHVTENIIKHSDNFRITWEYGDQELAQIIRDEQVDILIDLVGHTANHRLGVFGIKPAPVQATWLGYFGTTGMRQMDYIIADRWLVPAEEEQFYSERVARMPGSLYAWNIPSFEMPVSLLPKAANGYTTYGNFNNTCKITPEVVALWAEVLRADPTSKMVLNRRPFRDAGVRERFFGLFEAEGISQDRVDLRYTLGREPYFAAYRDVDIMLDTFPFGGGTTTSDSLWMGVPVVTLPADRFVGHMTESILHTLGLPEHIPTSKSDYVRIATELASNVSDLAALRANLRRRVESSPLCDFANYARDLEATFRWMWRDKTGYSID